MRNAECGMRNAECGMRNAECGMRNAECGMRNAECGELWSGLPRVKRFLYENRFSLYSEFDIPHSAFTSILHPLAPVAGREQFAGGGVEDLVEVGFSVD
jgi:hypothetical protein